jgi:hypothetical protein
MENCTKHETHTKKKRQGRRIQLNRRPALLQTIQT